MTELELIIDLHKNTERQGPGSTQETLKALNLINIHPGKKLNIADIGCGTGAPTITLAQNTNGQITAVDLCPDFLEVLNNMAEKLGFEGRIETLERSMDNLPFEVESLDIIWSEGAIYNIGFENGVREWKHFLKPDGYLAVSEITWTTNSRPKEVEGFWTKAYPEIDTASNKIKILEEHGFALKGYFNLAQESWVTNYYEPLEAGFEAFLDRNNHTDLAKKIVDDHKAETALYLEYRDFYSYGFYIAQRDQR